MAKSNEADAGVASDRCIHELEGNKEGWCWFLLLGIGLLVLGMIAIGSSFFVSLVTVVLFGFLLLVAGIAQVVMAFWTGRWSGFLLHLMIGILYSVAGFLIIDAPEQALLQLTLLMAAFFIISGIFRIVVAISVQFDHWGWALLSGVITLLLGMMIYRQWPASGFFVIGLFVGIEMIFNGWWWVMVALGLRRLSTEDACSTQEG